MNLSSKPSPCTAGYVLAFVNEEVCLFSPQRKADLVQPLEKEDEMSRTSNFIGEQADDYCDIMDWENPEQLPFAEVRKKKRILQELKTFLLSISRNVELHLGCTCILE